MPTPRAEPVLEGVFAPVALGGPGARKSEGVGHWRHHQRLHGKQGILISTRNVQNDNQEVSIGGTLECRPYKTLALRRGGARGHGLVDIGF